MSNLTILLILCFGQVVSGTVIGKNCTKPEIPGYVAVLESCHSEFSNFETEMCFMPTDKCLKNECLGLCSEGWNL